MIIGNGQLARAFENVALENTMIFASGVADSNCIEQKKFDREKNLLISALVKNPENKFVYFSSCALSADEYPKNEYYRHKQHMEEIIKTHSDNYYIFRVAQLFGCLKKHKTLINFIYNSIIEGEKFNVYHPSYRYVIDINDVVVLVESYLIHSKPRVIVNLSNNYRYNVEEIVKIFEGLLNIKAKYKLVKRSDSYYLDLNTLDEFIVTHNIKVNFNENYFRHKIEKRLRLNKLT